MKYITIYHNPRWGKSRNSVGILDQKNIPYKTIKYIDNPLSVLSNNIFCTSNLLEGVRVLRLDPIIQICSTSVAFLEIHSWYDINVMSYRSPCFIVL